MNPPVQHYARLIESIIGNAESPFNFDLPIVDALGHSRDVYRPLLIYSRLMAGQIPIDLIDIVTALDQSVWSMLVLQVAGEMIGRTSWTERAANAFGQMVDRQQSSGEFLPPDSSKNPESRWYEELLTLHAATSYAVRSPSPKLNSAIRRSAEFHLNETQPDHATAQPWGLLAFIRNAPPLADQVLHAIQMQYVDGVTGIPLLLLRDVLYGLRRLQT